MPKSAKQEHELGRELEKSRSVCWWPWCTPVHLTFRSASLLQQQMLKDENLKTVLDPKMVQKETHFFTSPSYNKTTVQLFVSGKDYVSLVDFLVGFFF